MIAVEIPVALADRPEVVPMPPCSTCGDEGFTEDFNRVPTYVTCSDCPSLVGQRVALAWRETCPTCRGDKTWERGLVGRCPDCTDGSRMVVGWTAEVAEVVPIGGGPGCGFRGDQAHLCNAVETLTQYHTDGITRTRWTHLLPLADWSPGRYALVLRDVRYISDDHATGLAPWEPMPCRPFSGFAEMSELA